MVKVVMIAAPLKKTEAVNALKPIEKYILANFGVFSVENQASVDEFMKMRESATLRPPDRHESGLEPILKYYDQLAVMEGKLPVSDSEIRLKFTWYDSYSKKSTFSGPTKQSLYSSAYERVNVLYNVAAQYSQIAKIQNFESDEGLKNACKLFQSASGVFRQVKDMVYVHLSTVPLPDLSSETLYALSAVMLAQAQESLYHKTTLDQMKNPICAKVAAQTGDLYADAVRLVCDQAVVKRWDKDLVPIVTAKQSYFLGMAEYHMGKECKSNSQHGESIARFRLAYGYVNDAAKKGESYFQPGDILAQIGRDLSQAEKDNNVIYSDLIPEPHKLTPIGRASLAKTTPLTFPLSNHQDLFVNVVPRTVHDALAKYESKRDALVQEEVGKLRDATQTLNGTLSSLNLPAALEDTSGEQLPPSLLEKARDLRENGGADKVTSLLQELPDLQLRNKEVLDETSRMMNEEEQGDNAMRERFNKEKWTRQPSNLLFKEHRAEIAKYQAILANATQADGIVRQKYGTHVNGMTLLSKSEAEVIQSVPRGQSGGSSDSKAVGELKALMDQVASLKASREAIEASLRDATADISGRFMAALEADGTVADESISESQMSETYGPMRQQVAESLSQQEVLIQKITAAHRQFMSGGGSVSARETVLKDLAAAYDAFKELKENLQEGAKFYNDLTTLLLKSQTKVGDLIFARHTEKEDLVRELQKSLSKADPAPPPRPAPYQSNPSSAPSQPTRPTPAPRQPKAPPRPAEPPARPAPDSSAVPPPYAPQASPQGPPPARPPQGYYQPAHGYAPQYGGQPPQAPYGYQQPPPNAGYPQQGYPQQGYPQQGHPQQGYPQQGHPQQGYPQQGYPQQGYPQQSYPAPPGYPHQGHQHPGYYQQ